LTELNKGSELQRLLVEAVRDHNVLPLTGRCNLSCRFCSHRYNPPGTGAYSFGPLSAESLSELAAYLDPGKKIIIGESATRLREGEPLTHPRFIDLLKELRVLYPKTMIQVTTNGSLLEPRIVDEFPALQPLELVISVNSINLKGRSMLMGDPDPDKICRMIKLLGKRQIGFHGSIVALPHLVGFADLKQTMLYLDQNSARSIRLLLPGFTRLTDPDLFLREDDIRQCYLLAAELQYELSTPLLPEPPLINDLQPLVAGVIRESTAESAGLKSGDLISAVNGQAPFSRVDAYDLLTERENPAVRIKRDQQILTLTILKAAHESSGVALSYDLDPRQVEQVRNSMDRQGKNLMLLSFPALKRWQIACKLRGLNDLIMLPVQSHWFGGTINCAGLLTVSDFQAALDRVEDLQSYRKILLPAVAFDRSGNDLRGFHYLTLNTRGIPLQLLD
jgi:NifB/MoaA-like Fe-S oxidoreductase